MEAANEASTPSRPCSGVDSTGDLRDNPLLTYSSFIRVAYAPVLQAFYSIQVSRNPDHFEGLQPGVEPAGGEPRTPALVEREAASHQRRQVQVVPRGHEDHGDALDDAELLPDPHQDL